MFRIKAHLDGEKLKIDGQNPACMKAGALKKECAKRGLSPMGYPDELLESLITYLKKHGGTNAGASSTTDNNTPSSSGNIDVSKRSIDEGDAGASLIHRILELRLVSI